MSELYLGLISGTSADGIDAALVDFSDNEIRLVDFLYRPFDNAVKTDIYRLSRPDAKISLLDYGATDALLGELFADAANTLLAQANISASAVTAIGSHGQTLYHAPDAAYPFSLQIGDPNIIAEKTDITTVADFRRRDMAVGGQGAPLVPAFHRAVFSQVPKPCCIVNIGGIANVTLLTEHDEASVTGFDTGPGNALMDAWIQKHKDLDYDRHGTWAASGKIHGGLIEKWLDDPYFLTPPPKSTGREYFSLAWLEQQMDGIDYRPEDVQASLCHLTACSISDAITSCVPGVRHVLLCGGGVHNDYLVNLLASNLRCEVVSTERYGIHPDHVEAMAFAWLARQTMHRLPGNLKAVTGAHKDVLLGGVYYPS